MAQGSDQVRDAPSTRICDMQAAAAEFAEERGWSRHHSPKNLATSLMVEAAELGEQFLWKGDEESYQLGTNPEVRQRIEDEMGDVLHNLVNLAGALGIDLASAFWCKFYKTQAQYPKEACHGKTHKHSHYS